MCSTENKSIFIFIYVTFFYCLFLYCCIFFCFLLIIFGRFSLFFFFFLQTVKFAFVQKKKKKKKTLLEIRIGIRNIIYDLHLHSLLSYIPYRIIHSSLLWFITITKMQCFHSSLIKVFFFYLRYQLYICSLPPFTPPFLYFSRQIKQVIQMIYIYIYAINQDNNIQRTEFLLAYVSFLSVLFYFILFLKVI